MSVPSVEKLGGLVGKVQKQLAEKQKDEINWLHDVMHRPIVRHIPSTPLADELMSRKKKNPIGDLTLLCGRIRVLYNKDYFPCRSHVLNSWRFR